MLKKIVQAVHQLQGFCNWCLNLSEGYNGVVERVIQLVSVSYFQLFEVPLMGIRVKFSRIMGFPLSEVEQCLKGPLSPSEVVHYLLFLIFQEVVVLEVV